ncbi:MAG TPA: hypothetical protein DDY18_06220 [Flavobacterium sp.]|mgnify:FL=1|jgi:predicted phage-related endonuclease|nr:hypothetical protein [Flavobacterium sp.]
MGRKKHTEKPHNNEEKLEKVIVRLERDINKLKSRNKSLEEDLKATAEYLMQISRDKTLDFIQQEIQDKTEVKTDKVCPRCSSTNMRRVNLGVVTIIACGDCEYRNRINESGQKT